MRGVPVRSPARRSTTPSAALMLRLPTDLIWDIFVPCATVAFLGWPGVAQGTDRG